MYGNTETAAQILGAKLHEKGMHKIRMYDVSKTHTSYLIAEAFKYSHMALLSVTYNLNLFPPMENFVQDMKRLNLQKRVVGIECDTDLAEKVAVIDNEIDEKERTIETLCLKLILHQQPVARDLRQISAALKMITDMERIGDQAEDIAEIICLMNGEFSGNEPVLEEMAKATIKMVTESVDAFVSHDIELAERVIKGDDAVDSYFDNIKKQLINGIEEKKIDGEVALDCLMIAKYLERIGDHAVNIAEWVIYSVTGIHKSSEIPS